MLLKTARWLFSGVSFAAAALVLLSPWTVASPFSGPLFLWVTRFLDLLFGGSGATMLTGVGTLTVVLPLIGSGVLVAPFLGLQLLVNDERHSSHCNGVALGIFLVAVAEMLTFILTKRVSWDPWQMLELVAVVVFGLLLIRSGITIMRISQPSFASARLVGWLMLSIGVCFSSFVLIPLGIPGSVVLYFVLGITFLPLPRLSQ